jgi:hypothetical protein
VAAAAGAFCGVEVLFPAFFDRLRTFAPFLRWVFGITIILSVMVCSYGVGILLGSGPVPVITPALPSPRPLPAVLPVVPVPVICPFASPQMKDPAQMPTKTISESLDKFIVVYRAGRGSAMPANCQQHQKEPVERLIGEWKGTDSALGRLLATPSCETIGL